MPVTLNVLKNDADPDNDPLTVAGLPQLVASTGNPNALDEISLSDDGEFFFLPTVAGDYVFLYAIIDGSERDAAYIRIRVDEADREPPADGDPRRRHDQPRRHPQRVRPRERHRSGRRRDRHRRLVGRRGHRGRAGARLRLPGDGAARRPGPHVSSPTRSPTAAATRRPARSWSRSATPTRPTSHRSPGPTRSRCGPVARHRRGCWSTTTTPRAARCASSACREVPGAELRIGPGGQEIFVSVDAATVSSFTFGYDVADEGGNQTGSLVQVRLVPIGDVNRPPVARPDVARTVSGQPIDIPVLANDSDPDGDAIQVETIAAQPTFGSATVDARRHDPLLATARRERLRPAALHGRRRQRRPCGRRGGDRRAPGRRREPGADRDRTTPTP